MDVMWLILINILFLGGALYTCLRLRTGYLPLEETVEDIKIWLKHRKEKKENADK